MSANWRKLSLGCERKARLFFMKKNTAEHLKGVNSKSAYQRRTVEQISEGTQLAKQHTASHRERARCQEQEVRPGKREEREGLREGMLMMCLCCGGSAGPQFHARDCLTKPTVGKSFQLNSPSHIQ